MSWSLTCWIWRAEGPVHVGISPAGSVNRCRLYVPARTMWGALTAELARHHAASTFPDYRNWGKKLRETARFSYLYPAEWDGQTWRAWLPSFEAGQGLVWFREDPRARPRLGDRQMRMRLLSTRAATAIHPETDTAAEASLRETECINTHWRDESGRPAGPLAFKGYVFLRDAAELVLEINTIVIGGDSRYGLGLLRQIESEPAGSLFDLETEHNSENPSVHTDWLLAHGEVTPQQIGQSEGASGAVVSLRGAHEVLCGWDESARGLQCIAGPLWVPGSRSDSKEKWRITDQGIWSLAAK